MKCVALIAVAIVSGAVGVWGADLAKAPNDELVQLLGSANVWQRRQAQRLLSERVTAQDKQVVERLAALAGPTARTLKPPPSVETRLAALGVLHASGTLTERMLDDAAQDRTAELRVWAARFTGERGEASKAALKRLEKLAADVEPTVRAAVATALRQFTGGSLTVNTARLGGSRREEAQTSEVPGKQSLVTSTATELLPHFKALLARPSVEGDFYYPHIVWMAMEPRVAQDPTPFFPLVGANDNSVSAYCARRVMRRIGDLTDAVARAQHLNAAMEWLGTLAARPGLAEAALDGLIDAFKSKGQPPTIPLEPIFQKLAANPKFADKARRLATLLGDTSASRALLAKINDAKASLEERLKGITAARETKDEAARAELLKFFKTPVAVEVTRLTSNGKSEPPHAGSDDKLQMEALRALATFGGDDIAYVITDAWKNFSLPTRRVASEVLVQRSKWSRALLAAVDRKVARPEDISATARRALARSEDSTVRDHADRVLGRYRATGEDKLKLIADKRKVVLAAEPDLQAGHEIAKTACLVCHKFHGEGADVGPDLTGVGRSTLDALLHNVVDPNEVIGAGYEATEVELKDGTTLSGRIVEDTPTRLKLVAAGPAEHVLARSDVAVENGKPKIRTLDLSLMPEGLEQLPDADFRNLIWFILNPPQDNRAWTPALRKELLGDENIGPGAKKSASSGEPGAAPTAEAPMDLESVALWNPDWRVICPPFEGAPAKLTEYHGRKNVLLTHPVDRGRPSALERTFEVPRDARLRFAVAAHDRGDWELRIVVNGELFLKQVIRNTGPRWKTFDLSLNRWAGQRVTVRLENAANDWSWEFGYWADLELKTAAQAAQAP